MLQNRVEGETDLRRAIENEAIVAPDGTTLLRYTDRVRYVEQLRRFEERFGRERVLVLIYEDFRADNEATVRRVLSFLGVEEEMPIETVEANPSVRVRSARADDAVRALQAGRGPAARAAKTAGRLLPERLRSSLLGALRRRLLYAEPEPPDPELMAELRRRFKPEVVALSDHIGRDLVSLWGYDELG
jgi:hypothetical protein